VLVPIYSVTGNWFTLMSDPKIRNTVNDKTFLESYAICNRDKTNDQMH